MSDKCACGNMHDITKTHREFVCVYRTPAYGPGGVERRKIDLPRFVLAFERIYVRENGQLFVNTRKSEDAAIPAKPIADEFISDSLTE